MEAAWTSVRARLAGHISESNFRLWVEPLECLRLEGRTLVLGCPNRFFQAWVQENYGAHFAAALESVRQEDIALDKVEFILSPTPRPAPQSERPVHRQPELPRLEAYGPAPLRFNPRYTFNRFVVGSPNQYAFAAAQAMAQGRELNTDALFILAAPGLGKSHLSQAVGQHILAQSANQRVYYLTAEDFTNEMIHAIKTNNVEDFKNKYRRGCDVLVLEEIQFLGGKEKVQAELSFTLDNLMERKKKIVFTSAQLPRDIPRLNHQLSSRLTGSLISTIEPPDYETRLRILQQNALEAGLEVPDVVIEYLARRLSRDVRQLESSLKSIGARSRLLNRPIDLALAAETLGDLVPPTSAFNLEVVQEHICRYYQISREDLLSRSRRKNIVLPRNVGMYLCRKLTATPLETIGRAFDRNHSTVLYAVNLIESRSRRDAKLQAQVEFLLAQLHRIKT